MNLEHGLVVFSRLTQTIVISGGELTLATGGLGVVGGWGVLSELGLCKDYFKINPKFSLDYERSGRGNSHVASFCW